MKRAFLFLTLAAHAVAQEAAPAPAAKPEPYQLKNRSAFTLTSETRVPFLPIGFSKSATPIAATPTKAPTTPVVRALELKAEHFTVTSILVQPGQIALATINSRSFAEGEVMPVVFNGQNVAVAVRAIRDGNVYLEYDGKQLVVPLKRSEVPMRQPGNPDTLNKPSSIVIDTQPARPGRRSN